MSIVKLNNQGVKNATAFGSITGLGSMIFIKKLTASSSATLSFVDGSDGVVLDDTYKEYVFTFNNMHPATDNVEFSFQANVSGGSGYNETVTSTMFYAYHQEDDGGAGLDYSTSGDQAQGTNFIKLGLSLGNDNDQSLSGTLQLFNPSSTTFVKHFMARCNYAHPSNISEEDNKAGYFNTTSAIDEIQFKMSSGNIDAGDICLYGIA
tara:strand:- start:1 stop:621 length:621 start_codon:yes stop_codon:yes gene_type:complete